MVNKINSNSTTVKTNVENPELLEKTDGNMSKISDIDADIDASNLDCIVECNGSESSCEEFSFAPYYIISHKSYGRMRLRVSKKETDITGLSVAELIVGLPDFAIVEVSPITGSVLICLDPSPHSASKSVGIKNPIPAKLISYLFPLPVRATISIIKSIPYLINGFVELIKHRRLGLDVLDASALLVCLLRRDFKSLGSIVFFFALGEYLTDWTKKKSEVDLAKSLEITIKEVWIKNGDTEVAVPISSVVPGSIVVVHAGGMIPVDGKVVFGEGMVNQASMTGESLPVQREVGSSVFAGTVLESGEIHIDVVKVGSETRVHSILKTIAESEAAKAGIQGKYERVADAVVPYNFALAGAVYALTRDTLRAGSVLLVDYSCALRLGTPLSILTAIQEAANCGILIKGGKFAEALANADVVVFDKTGTLTEANPTVVDVIPFGKHTRSEILKIAACLEEHFPHPVGVAVVRAAEEENLSHREEHAKVELIVAHGIISQLYDKRIILGSAHFVLHDSGITTTTEQDIEIKKHTSLGRSVLYLAFDGEIAGIILIEDKLRENAADVVSKLKASGVKRVIMLTGDGELTAANIAEQAGITEYRSQLLPEDKANVINELRAEGHTVLMLGDGINDSPGLSAANVGAALFSGADVTKEIADIVLTRGDLSDLLVARDISRKMLKRIHSNFRTSVIWNSVFLFGGILGFLSSAVSALLHNASTIGIAIRSTQKYLDHSAIKALPANTQNDLNEK